MVLNDNSPKYIEEFYSINSDVFNSYNGGTDPNPDVDWWPAFARASVSHLSLDPNDPRRKQRTYGFVILLGKTRDVYRLSKPLPAFASFIGLYEHVKLRFYKNTNGVLVHYPDTKWKVNKYDLLGTFHGGPEILPHELKDWEGYGAYRIVLKNIEIIGTNAEGTRGLVIHRTCTVENCYIRNFGWHGVHISADHLRNPGAGNANGSFIQGLRVDSCGWFPGSDDPGERYDKPWNPKRLRPYGSGLRIEGGDANVIKVIGYSGRFNAYAAIHDSGFLGNHHIMPLCVVGNDGKYRGGFILGADYKAICDDVANYVETHRRGDPLYDEALHDQREFCYYDANMGDRVKVAYVINHPAACSMLETPYVEKVKKTSPPPIINVQKPSMVIMGIGGRLWEGTTRQEAEGFHGSVRVRPLAGTNSSSKPPSITYGKVPGALSYMSTGSERKDNNKGDYWFKYVNFNNDDPNSPGPHKKHAGWYRLDSQNSNYFIALLMTAFDSELAGRKHDQGRICIPQEVLLGEKARRLIFGAQPTPQQHPKNDPTNPAHNLQEADLYLYTGTRLAPGQGLLWVVVNNGGTLEWEQRL